MRRDDKDRSDEGFTLIELLIVIVILGVLSTVVVFAVRGITDRGTDSACQADFKTLEVAVEAARAEDANAPVDETSLVTGGFLRSESQLYDVDGTGEISVDDTNGSDCPLDPFAP